MISDASRNGLLFMNGPWAYYLTYILMGRGFPPWRRSHVPNPPLFGIYFLSAC